jgi:hypothetical protein
MGVRVRWGMKGPFYTLQPEGRICPARKPDMSGPEAGHVW